jgi:signal transduction histidine kinase
LEDVKRQAAVLAQEHGVHIAEGTIVPATVAGDELRLRELLLNLVDNAIKYSFKEGTVEINLTTADHVARVAVTDHGIGIAPEEQAHIFQRFFRTDRARAHVNKGTGLGLSICKWIVEAHHGTIEVTSQAGAGATFTVALPLITPPSH